VHLKFGLISCDSHGQLDRDAFTKRMSKEKWGDRIPQVVEIENDQGQKIERWSLDGKVPKPDLFSINVVNCPAAMGDPTRRTHPQRWAEVPKIVYDPAERLTALDADGVDAEVLFPNNPTQNFGFPGDPDYELACVHAYNDALNDYRRVSDRYVPLALVPYKSSIAAIVKEITEAVENGAGGVVMLTEPSITVPGVKSTADPFWEPLWSTCEELEVPICWHGSGGLSKELAVPMWAGYSRHQAHTASTARLCVSSAQMLANLFFAGILERHPRLNWMLGETGMGWLAYVLESCDHEWERRQLWRDGFETRPSEVFNRQLYADFWFEKAGIAVRDVIGIDNIMWESDYPHVTATYPNSREYVRRVLEGIPKDEQAKMLWENAARLFRLNIENGAPANG
jgi:predicted TIM-barrel fold metal-dependent hydrolase